MDISAAAFKETIRSYSRQNTVHADDAVRPGGAAVVHNGCITLDPDPASLLGQETVILSGDLTFNQHCRMGQGGERKQHVINLLERVKRIKAGGNNWQTFYCCMLFKGASNIYCKIYNGSMNTHT